MNFMTVHIFDVDKVKHRFLEMCTTLGQGAGIAETISGKMDAVLSQHGIPWKSCVCMSISRQYISQHGSTKFAMLLDSWKEYSDICNRQGLRQLVVSACAQI